MWFRCQTFSVTVVLFCTLSSAFGEKLNCFDLSVADCKTKFGRAYDEGFKAIHLAAVKDLLEMYEKIGRDIQAELPTENADTKEFKAALDKFETYLTVFKENENDNKKLAQTILDVMQDFNKISDLDIYAKSDDIFEKHEFTKRFYDRWSNMEVAIAKLYSNMYANLREEDHKAYPEYRDLNEMMNSLKTKNFPWPSSLTYAQVRQRVGSYFDAPYIRALNEAFPATM